MNRWLFIIGIGALLNACTSGYKTENIRYDYLINDDNSKVWLIQQHTINGKDVVPTSLRDKQLIIFYTSGKLRMLQLKNVGTPEYRTGSYYVNSDEKLIDIRINGKNWQLSMDQISEDSLTLNATKRSDIKENVKLIPFPEY